MNGAVSKVNKKFISQLTRAKRTTSAAAIVPVSHVLITIVVKIFEVKTYLRYHNRILE